MPYCLQLLNLSVDQLMDRAFDDRPDLQAQMSEIPRRPVMPVPRRESRIRTSH